MNSVYFLVSDKKVYTLTSLTVMKTRVHSWRQFFITSKRARSSFFIIVVAEAKCWRSFRGRRTSWDIRDWSLLFCDATQTRTWSRRFLWFWPLDRIGNISKILSWGWAYTQGNLIPVGIPFYYSLTLFSLALVFWLDLIVSLVFALLTVSAFFCSLGQFVRHVQRSRLLSLRMNCFALRRRCLFPLCWI